ncbi:MAG: acyloxyacyl hydrolase [Rhodanobacter sp.]
MNIFGTRLRVILTLSVGLASLPSAATTRLEVEAGVSYMDCSSAPTGFIESVFGEKSIGTSSLTWSPDISLGWIDGRSVERYRYSRYTTEDSAWLIATGVRIHYGNATDWYRSLFFSFQPVLHSGRTQALSSVYEFASTLGWQGKRFSVQIRHISNGSLHEPNRGETMALVGVAFNP